MEKEILQSFDKIKMVMDVAAQRGIFADLASAAEAHGHYLKLKAAVELLTDQREAWKGEREALQNKIRGQEAEIVSLKANRPKGGELATQLCDYDYNDYNT